MTRKAASQKAATTEAETKGEENLTSEEADEDEDGIETPPADNKDEDTDENDGDDDSDDDNEEDDLAEQDRDFEETHGFPPRTAEKDMTPEQQLAYNKHLKKKYEQKYKVLSKSFEGLTSEELERLRGIETAHTELLAKKPEAADTDKLVEEAKASVRAKFAPLLVTAKLQALSEGRIEEGKLAKIIGRLNLNDFITDEGDFDEDAIKEFADDFFDVAPVTKSSSDHQGYRESKGTKPLTGIEAGRQRALARSGKGSSLTN